jgi:dynein heavy chain
MVDASSKPNEYKSILFALCYYHAAILGRKKFGAPGWSRVYNFNDGDLTICADILNNYLEKFDQVPWKDIRYLYGSIMYGGHITDHWDRRTNNTYLDVLIDPKLLHNMNLIPSASPIYRILDPNKSNYVDYQKYIEKLPTESPQMFGMHPNAEINFLTNLTDTVFTAIVDMQGASAGGGGGDDGGISAMVAKYKETIPPYFDMNKIQDVCDAKNEGKAPTPYDTVVMQESDVMNVMLLKIFTSLEELELGLAGALNMTDSMEDLATALSLNRVPAPWSLFYFSKRPLNSWYTDLANRCTQLSNWTTEMIKPISLSLSYFFNPLSFLTAITQTTARGRGLPLDQMTTQTNVTWFNDYSQIKENPADGAYIHGLFLEGAAWENSGEGQEGYLVDQKLKELHPNLPVVNVISVLNQDKKTKAQYECPVYYTTMRGPVFIFKANLNMESEEVPQSKWILSGTA